MRRALGRSFRSVYLRISSAFSLASLAVHFPGSPISRALLGHGAPKLRSTTQAHIFRHDRPLSGKRYLLQACIVLPGVGIQLPRLEGCTRHRILALPGCRVYQEPYIRPALCQRHPRECRAACGRRAVGGRVVGGHASPPGLAHLMQQQGLPVACLPQCVAVLQGCAGPLRRRPGIGCAQDLGIRAL